MRVCWINASSSGPSRAGSLLQFVHLTEMTANAHPFFGSCYLRVSTAKDPFVSQSAEATSQKICEDFDTVKTAMSLITSKTWLGVASIDHCARGRAAQKDTISCGPLAVRNRCTPRLSPANHQYVPFEPDRRAINRACRDAKSTSSTGQRPQPAQKPRG